MPIQKHIQWLLTCSWFLTGSESQFNITVRRIPGMFSESVTFNNGPCLTSTGILPTGTCYLASECQEKNGTPSGSCAEGTLDIQSDVSVNSILKNTGFGVCCTFVPQSCGGTFAENGTLCHNIGFPSPAPVNRACPYNLEKCSASIIAIRLDFLPLTLPGDSGTAQINGRQLQGPPAFDCDSEGISFRYSDFPRIIFYPKV